MSTYFVIGFIVYVVVLIAIAYFSTRGKVSGENYLTGGRNLGLFLIVSTVSATMVGTGSSMGATANGFRFGWGGSVYGIGGALAMLVMAILYSGARNKKFLTMSEEAQYYFGGSKNIRLLMGFMMFVIQIVWLGNHMNGGSKYLAYVTGLDPVTAKLITVLAFSIYVFIGGYLAVVTTDAIQMVVVSIGFITIAIMAIPAAGGWEAIRETMIATNKPGNLTFYGIGAMGGMSALSLVFSTFMGVIGTPTHRTRIYTSSNSLVAKKGFFIGAAILFAFSLLPSLIGITAYTIASNTGAESVMANPDFAFSYMATTVLGPGLGLLFLIAGLSATLSSGDSDAIAAVTILLTDVYTAITGKKIADKDIPKFSRVALILAIVLAFVATLYATDVIGYINNVVGSLLPGVAVTMLMGRLWKRATWQGGYASVISGVLFGICFLTIPPFASYFVGIFKGPAIPASIISVTCGVVASLLTKPVFVSEEKIMEMIIAGRGK